jgi:hypothetical protein
MRNDADFKRISCGLGVSVPTSDHERNILETMAHDVRVSRNTIMFLLIRYFLTGKISWADLLQQNSEILIASDPSQDGTKYITVKLEPEEWFPFARRAEEIGSTPAIILKKLIASYVAGKIERGDIWR